MKFKIRWSDYTCDKQPYLDLATEIYQDGEGYFAEFNSLEDLKSFGLRLRSDSFSRYTFNFQDPDIIINFEEMEIEIYNDYRE